MSEIKLFRIIGKSVAEIPGEAVELEKSLQSLIEANLETFLGIRFLKTEMTTGKTHAGRIDTLGIDENHFPVIIEYKKTTNETVINQGLFYLDWLLDHKADFKLLVLERFGKEAAEKIDWLEPRLICIAADFTKYDLHAVQQIARNIDLVRYRRFGDELLAFELVHTVAVDSSHAIEIADNAPKPRPKDKSVAQALRDLDPKVRDIYGSLRAFLLALGDDATEKITQLYVAFRRIKNFACVVVQKSSLVLYLKLDLDEVKTEPPFSRDVRDKGHWGTGDFEVTIETMADLERAKPLLQKAYAGS